jgi:hypothetical protein
VRLLVASLIVAGGCDLVFAPAKGGGDAAGGGDGAEVADGRTTGGDGATGTADAPSPIADATATCGSLFPPCAGGVFVLSCNNTCFALCDESRSWDDAETLCGTVGGHLAGIPSTAANSCVDQVMSLAAVPRAWIGLRQNDGAAFPIAGWHWIDGSSFSTFGWDTGSGQPDDADGDEADHSEQCGFTTGMWADEPCASTFPFVCSAPGS